MSEIPEGYKNLLLVLSVPGLYCAFVLVGRQLKRQHGVKLGLLYHLFAISFAVYFPAALLLDLKWTLLRHLGAAVVLLGSVFLIALVDRYVWETYFQRKHGVVVPKFLTELARLVILVIAVFLVLEFFYGQTIKGLLLAPGIAAVAIGLAMQDLLGNIIAGLALQIGKPFSHGDWLFIENRYAEVIEINWRSTRLRTLDHVSIEIPNREVSRQTIMNLNRPQRSYGVRVGITLDAEAAPTRVKSVLLHAATNTQGVAAEPKPKVYLKEFGDSGIQYEIKFWMEDYSQCQEVCDSVRTHVWYGLHRHGIRIPYPTRTLHIERPVHDKQQEVHTAARVILRQQPLFKCLNDEQLDQLLPRGKSSHYGLGEKLIRQGDQGDSMFILVEGQANVVVDVNGAPRFVASLESGDCFGEMSLLTGEQRSATVIAQTDCEVVEIGKSVLAKSLKEHPELLSQLSELLAVRQMKTEGIVAAGAQPAVDQARQTQYTATFTDKLRKFFEM